MLLFVVANFFRRRRPRRANDEMPAGPLLQVLLFWVLFGTAVLFGSLATTAALDDTVVILQRAFFATFGISGSRYVLFATPEATPIQPWGYRGYIV